MDSKSWQHVLALTAVVLLTSQYVASGSLCEKYSLVLSEITNYKRFTHICDNTNNLSISENTTVKLWIDFINCTVVSQGLFANLSNIVQTLVLSAPLSDNLKMVRFLKGVFDNLGSVSNLQLRGFENLRHIDQYVLSSLANIRCLYFEDFGKFDMSFQEILSVLHDLSGTPLKSVDMNRIQSFRNLDNKLNLSVLAIPNMNSSCNR